MILELQLEALSGRGDSPSAMVQANLPSARAERKQHRIRMTSSRLAQLVERVTSIYVMTRSVVQVG